MKSSFFFALTALVVLTGCQLNSPAVTEEVNFSPLPTVTAEAELPLPASPPSVPDSLPSGEPVASDDTGMMVDDEAVVTSSPEMETVYCPADAMECPDGSYVGRDPANNCEFMPCPAL